MSGYSYTNTSFGVPTTIFFAAPAPNPGCPGASMNFPSNFPQSYFDAVNNAFPNPSCLHTTCPDAAHLASMQNTVTQNHHFHHSYHTIVNNHHHVRHIQYADVNHQHTTCG